MFQAPTTPNGLSFSKMQTLVRILVVMVSLFSILTSAKASIYPGSNAGWVVLSSHSQLQAAINKARQYTQNYPTVVVFQSTNGYYAVSLGWAPKNQGNSIIRLSIIGGMIPGDSYIHNGKRWARAVWSANGAHLLAGDAFLKNTRLSGRQTPPPPPPSPQKPFITPMSPTAALVSDMSETGDTFLSLRQGPNTTYPEIVRMRTNTPLTIIGKSSSWLQVKLQNGMTGFAYAKYISLGVPTIGPERNANKNPVTIGPKPAPPVLTQIKDAIKNPSDNSKPDPANDQNISNEKRVALVIGNSNYENTAALANPKNDAAAMAKKLKGLGFTVIKGLDQSKAGMEATIRKFVKELPHSDVALFFYAGHAMQVSGINYLIPVNAALEDSTAVDFETINFNVILDFMNAPNRTSIALLDACRNNPLARNFTRKLGKARAAFVGRGLAAPSSGEGQLLIGFATAPGEVALDGEGKNSPFTTALLKHMATPGLEIELMLKRVKADVFDETHGNQSPWNNSALRKEFYFAK